MVKNPPAKQETQVQDMGSRRGRSHGSGRSPRAGNGNPHQYSCLGNPMDRGAWRATVMGMQKVGHDLVTKPLPPPKECHILVKETGTKGRHLMRKISGKSLSNKPEWPICPQLSPTRSLFSVPHIDQLGSFYSGLLSLTWTFTLS